MTPAGASRFRLIVAFATIYILWGSSYLAIRFAVETIPPFLMGGARFVVAGAIVYVIAYLRESARLSRKDWLHAFVVGTLLFAGGNGALVWGEQTVPSGIAALLVASVPIWMVVMDWARPHGRPQNAWTVGGLLLGLSGVAILLGPDAFTGRGIDPLGAAVILGGAVSWAAGTIYAKRVAKPPSALAGTSTQMLCGGVVLLVAAALTGEPARFSPSAVTGKSLLGVFYLVVFASVIAFTAYSWLVRVTTPARLGTYAYVNPLIAVYVGWAVANEPVTLRTIAAAAIIVVAVAIVTLTAEEEPSQATRLQTGPMRRRRAQPRYDAR
jgi:drug/metabolite transporter (DMT)-like permease